MALCISRLFACWHILGVISMKLILDCVGKRIIIKYKISLNKWYLKIISQIKLVKKKTFSMFAQFFCIGFKLVLLPIVLNYTTSRCVNSMSNWSHIIYTTWKHLLHWNCVVLIGRSKQMNSYINFLTANEAFERKILWQQRHNFNIQCKHWILRIKAIKRVIEFAQ